MYIPLTYWESQADTLAQTNAKFCVFGALSTVPQTISYSYETSPFSYTFTQKEGITNICQDTTDQSVFYRPLTLGPGLSGLMMLTSQPYFCSATITSSAGIPSTCCVQTPPNTGPEAWYIDIKYVGTDNGTFYFYYINQYGDLVNDTITFAEGTKRIVSQTAAFWIKNASVGFTNFLNWNLISKFPGQVIPYRYKDLPAKYTFTLKRTDPGGLGVANFNNYWYQTTGSLGLSGSLVSIGSASVGTQLSISSYNVPMANSAIYYNAPNAEVSVSVVPQSLFSSSISWSYTENSQDGLFTIYNNANTITTLSGSATGNTLVSTGTYITASLTPVNYPSSGVVVMDIYANGNAVTQSIGSSANTTITASFLAAPTGSRFSITASITYYPNGIPGMKSYVFLAGPAGGTATYRLAGNLTNSSSSLSANQSIQVCAYTNSVSITGTDSKQFAGPVCGNVFTASCDCYSASFTAGVLPPYAVQYIPCSSSVFSYVLLDFPQTFSGCISYPSSSLATAGQSGSPTSSLSLSGSCKSGNCP
jgi:hypothetical protein